MGHRFDVSRKKKRTRPLDELEAKKYTWRNDRSRDERKEVRFASDHGPLSVEWRD
jgi:hypothetical protein